MINLGLGKFIRGNGESKESLFYFCFVINLGSLEVEETVNPGRG